MQIDASSSPHPIPQPRTPPLAMVVMTMMLMMVMMVMTIMMVTEVIAIVMEVAFMAHVAIVLRRSGNGNKRDRRCQEHRRHEFLQHFSILLGHSLTTRPREMRIGCGISHERALNATLERYSLNSSFTFPRLDQKKKV
jgi:hypothetical protein